MTYVYKSNNLEKYSRLMMHPAIDRSGTLQTDILILDKLTEVVTNLSFEEVISENLKTLISGKTDLHVMWSGGRDSTLLLLMLEDLITPEQSLSIITNPVAEQVNPYAFDYFTNKYPLVYHKTGQDTLKDVMISGGFIITGYGCDMLLYDIWPVDFTGLTKNEYFSNLASISGHGVSDYEELFNWVQTAFGQELKNINDYIIARNILLDWQFEQLHVGMIAGYGALYEDFGSPFLMPLMESWVRCNFNDHLKDESFYLDKQIITDLICKRNPWFLPHKVNIFLNLENPYEIYNKHGRYPERITSDWEYTWNS